MNESLSLLKRFLQVLFVERNLTDLAEMVTEDYHSYGFANDRRIESRAALSDYFRECDATTVRNLRLSIENGEELTPDAATLNFTLANGDIRLKYRASGFTRMTDAGRKIYFLQAGLIENEESDSLLRGITHSKNSMELLRQIPSGGIYGAYLEPGYPFYAINQTMLDLLGYADKALFIVAIDGLWINCIHPDDRALVEREVKRQMQEGERFTLEYRMLRHDGRTVWVHEIGKAFDAGNGRRAMLSTCFDTTVEKEHTLLIEKLVKDANGGMALYELDADMNVTVLYTNEDTGRVAGYTQEEYLHLCQNGVMNTIYAGDRAGVGAAIATAIREEKAVSHTYRVPRADGKGYTWITGTFSKYGERDDKMVLRAVYTPSALQNELQALSHANSLTGIVLRDAHSGEIYYANEACFTLHGSTPSDYTGKRCRELFRVPSAKCHSCRYKNADCSEEALPDTCVTFGEHTLAVHMEKRSWHEREVVVEYLYDITETVRLQQTNARSRYELDAFLQNVACGFCVCKLEADGRSSISYISHGFCELFDGDVAELRAVYDGNPLAGILPEDAPHVKKKLEAMRKKHDDSDVTFRCRTLKGKLKWILLRMRVVRDPELGYISYATYFDVSAQMNAQQQLKGLLEHTPSGICLYRCESNGLCQLSANQHLARMLGVDAAALLPNPTTASKVVHPEDFPLLRKHVGQVLNHYGEESSFAFRIWNANIQRYIWLRLDAVPILQEDGSVYLYVNYTNIDDEIQLRQQAEAERQRYKHLYDTVDCGIFEYDFLQTGFRFNTVNAAGLKMLGYTEAEFRAKKNWDFADTIHPDDIPLIADMLNQLRTASDNCEETYRMRRKDGSFIWVNSISQQVGADGAGGISIESVCMNIDSLKRAELALAEERELTNLILANNPMSFWSYENKPQRYMRRLGTSHQKTFSDPIFDYPDRMLEDKLLHPDSRESFHDFIAALDAGAPTANARICVKDDNGKFHWLHVQAIRLNAAQDTRIVGWTSDITSEVERKALLENEIILQHQANEYNLIAKARVNLTENTMESYTVSGNYAIEISQKSYADAFDIFVNSACTAQQRNLLNQAMAPTKLFSDYEGGCYTTTLEWQRRLKNDGYIWVRTLIKLFSNPTNGDILAFIYSYDINDDRLREQMYHSLTDIFYEYATGVDLKSGRFFGHVMNKRIPCLPPERGDSYTAALEATLTPDIPADEFEMIRRNMRVEGIRENLSRQEKFQFNFHIMQDDGMHTKRVSYYYLDTTHNIVVLMREDITKYLLQESERANQLERALKDANAAILAKSAFLSRMSHEIRTPMNTIIGMTALALESSGDAGQVKQSLESIDTSGHYLLSLINDILEMSRIESGRLHLAEETFDFATLKDTIRALIEPLAKSSGITLHMDDRTPADADPAFIGDSLHIKQVLVNLLSNAVKFSGIGKMVDFIIERAEETENISTYRFIVHDQGIGMRADFLPRLFEPFVQEDASNTSRFDGSGLGLSIAKSLSDAMGGNIAVESRVNVGSTFTVTLPFKRLHRLMPRRAGSAAAPADISALEGLRVLVAEDHPLNVMLIRKVLEHGKMIPEIAENGREVVDKFAASAPGYYDMILMDVRMPVMDGLDATRAIRTLKRADARMVPIIAMTANAMTEDRVQTHRAGMDDHLAKPFEPQTLYAMMLRLLQR